MAVYYRIISFVIKEDVHLLKLKLLIVFLNARLSQNIPIFFGILKYYNLVVAIIAFLYVVLAVNYMMKI